VNTPLPAQPRSEPLLWLQLLGLGALPLEALLVLLLLAGSDPGPWPWLERGLAWALGVLAPCLLLWRRPADAFSLLLISTPLRGRRELQRRLSSLQQALGLRLALVVGAAGLLPLLAWLDRWSVLARELALLPEAPRLVALLLSAAVLALMLWQWQQLLQAIWLLLRPAATLAAAAALTAEEIAGRRLCLGLPLLLPDPLRFDPRPSATPGPQGVAARRTRAGRGADARAADSGEARAAAANGAATTAAIASKHPLAPADSSAEHEAATQEPPAPTPGEGASSLGDNLSSKASEDRSAAEPATADPVSEPSDQIAADLAEADLAVADASLTEANLNEADLTEADSAEADHNGAGLPNGDLTEADHNDADLAETDLAETDLSETDLAIVGGVDVAPAGPEPTVDPPDGMNLSATGPVDTLAAPSAAAAPQPEQLLCAPVQPSPSATGPGKGDPVSADPA
jgi:hypothetical protein